MLKRTLHVASYDIRHPKRLHRALQVLKAYSTGGQKSVFECYLSDIEKKKLIRSIDSILDHHEDSFLLVALDSTTEVRTLGVAVLPEDPPFYFAG